MFEVLKCLKKVAITAGIVAGLALSSSVAEAAPIGNASFGIGGAFNLPSGTHLGNTNSLFISNGGMITVSAGDTMDLSALVTLGMTGTMQDLPSLSGFMPISGFISLASGVTVDLNTLTVYGQFGPAPGFISIAGNAIIHAPGFDATSGVLTFSGTTSDNTTFTLAVTTSANTPASVPEPMSIALLALGLLALFAMAHRRQPVTARAMIA